MFNWLGNLFPYSDLHSLNLDWLLSKMKETAAQAAQAIADSAKALAQVIEAKTAAQNAQTAAQNAQTAANNAQTAANNAANSAENAVAEAQAAKSAAQTAQNTADAAKSAAQTAQNTANTAKSAAETAQNTANTAQSAAQTAQTTAQTAQSTADTAQSAADTANNGIAALNKRFPVKNADIKDSAVTLEKLDVKKAYLYKNTDPDANGNIAKFPRDGTATIEQITSGIFDTYVNRLSNLFSDYLQISMDITEVETAFTCVSPVVKYINKVNGLAAIAPIFVIKNDTNDIYSGFIRLSQEGERNSKRIKCEVIFNATPPFGANAKFVIYANPVSAKLNAHV